MPLIRMPVRTRELVVRYLSSLPGNATGSTTAPATPDAASPTDAAALYARLCAPCHGARGGGDGPNAKYLPVPPANHASADVMSRRSDDALYDTIAGGGGIMNRSPRMPAFGGTLEDAQMRALVAHIRVLCRCQGPGWSRASGGAAGTSGP